MPDTSIPDSHRDLLQTPVGILTTAGRDGLPQTTAVWFIVDQQDRIVLSLLDIRQKTRNLRRRPECGFFILDPANPYRTLEIRARAEITPDPNYTTADRVLAKYGNVFDPRTADPPGARRQTVTLHPVNVIPTTIGG